MSNTIMTVPKMAGRMPPSVFDSRGSPLKNSRGGWRTCVLPLPPADFVGRVDTKRIERGQILLGTVGCTERDPHSLRFCANLSEPFFETRAPAWSAAVSCSMAALRDATSTPGFRCASRSRRRMANRFCSIW